MPCFDYASEFAFIQKRETKRWHLKAERKSSYPVIYRYKFKDPPELEKLKPFGDVTIYKDRPETQN